MDTTATTSTHSRQEFRDPARVLTSLLAPIEKRCLIWLAGRLPRSINSDHLTVLALVAMVAAGRRTGWLESRLSASCWSRSASR